MLSDAEFHKLILNQNEIYQDIIIDGVVKYKGVRECEKRFKMIDQCISSESVILELGSSYGYFAIKLAKKYKDSLILSFERDEETALIQKEILEREKIKNVILLNHNLTQENLLVWSRVVEKIDCVIAMSVLHNYEPLQIKNVLRLFNSLSPRMIIELPGEDETNAVGHKTMEEITPYLKNLGEIFDGTYRLGESRSHVQDVNRKLYMMGGPINKRCLTSYINCPEVQTLHDITACCGTWKKNEKEFKVNGVNLWNMLFYNIIYPSKDELAESARKAYEKLLETEKEVSDIRPWNLLITPNGVEVIDYKFKVPKDHPMAYQKDHVTKTLKIIRGEQVEEFN